MTSAIRARITTRLHRAVSEGEGGFALVFALLIILIVSASSIAVAGVLYSQVQPSQYARKFVRTVNGAEAGMQAALGQIRNSTDSTGAGDLTKLPCTYNNGATLVLGTPPQSVSVSGDQISGTVMNDGNTVDSTSYRTVIAYYSSDPTSHENDPTWMHDNAIPCLAGLVKTTPAYAFIQSFGKAPQVPGLTASQGNRTQHAVYEFSATNTNVIGGRLVEFGTSNPGMCLDVESTTPALGTQPQMESCLALGTPQQTWQYRNDLTLFYAGNPSLNFCLQNMNGTPRLERCETSGSGTTYPYADSTQQAQEWGFNDNGQFSSALSDGTVINGSGGTLPSSGCLVPTGATTGTPAPPHAYLKLDVCNGATTGMTAWNPDPQLGAGKAGGNTTGVPGVPTNQFVNYAEFGRCLDVTGQNVNADHLIDYPCKQAPDSSKLTWNQVWTYTVVANNYGKFYTTYSGTQYCLTAPASATRAGGVPAWVTVTPCQATPPDTQLWQATGKADTYQNSYLLINKYDSLCMAADPSQQPTFLSSTMVVTNCDGSGVPSSATTKNPLLLKWNAPAVPPGSGLSNVQEDNGSVTSQG